MTLREKIISDLKDAMKSGDAVRRDTLRMLDSAMKNLEIEKKKRETGLSEEEVLEAISRAVKQRQDSIKQFEQGGRPELAEKEKIELEILIAYLPAQLSKEELSVIVRQVITEAGATSPADLGKIMGQIMGKVKGKADGNLVREIAMAELEKNN